MLWSLSSPPEKFCFHTGKSLLLNSILLRSETVSYLQEVYEGVRKDEVKMGTGKKIITPLFLPLIMLMLYVLPCCTTEGRNSQTVVHTRDTTSVRALHRRSQHSPLETLDSLHGATGREGLRSSALPSPFSVLEYVKADGWIFMRVNTSRLVIYNITQHIQGGLERGLKLPTCTTLITVEDTKEHGKSHPEFQHQI